MPSNVNAFHAQTTANALTNAHIGIMFFVKLYQLQMHWQMQVLRFRKGVCSITQTLFYFNQMQMR